MLAELARRVWRHIAHPRRAPLPLATRQAVWRRDGGRCRVCGSTRNLQYGHIVAYAAGGSDDVDNLELECQSCNRAKGPAVPVTHRLLRAAQWLAVGVVLAAAAGTVGAIVHPLPGAAAIVRTVTGR